MKYLAYGYFLKVLFVAMYPEKLPVEGPVGYLGEMSILCQNSKK